MNEDKKCPSGCKDDLTNKIECKVSKSSLAKMAGIIVIIVTCIWTIGYSVASKDTSRRETAIQHNTQTIANTREKLSSIDATLAIIQKTQNRIQDTQQQILRELRRQNGAR